MTVEGTTSPPEGPLTARDRFRRAVREAGGARKAAQVIGCTRAYIDMLVSGARDRPGMQTAYEIQRRMGIPMQAWMEDAPPNLRAGA